MEVIIKKSDKPEKKFVAIINNDKKVYFGAAGYSDYLQHNDDKRKERYIKRLVSWGYDEEKLRKEV